MEEIKRKLASIRYVSEISPIEGADNIELAIVDGWQCIVKKDVFKQGDLCIYFEIDSFLPIRPEFEFLRKSSYRKIGEKEGFLVRTIRLKGEISQGLALGFDDIPPFALPFPSKDPEVDVYNGYDLTEYLGIEKYEKPIPACLSGKVKGNFPSFIRKTDLERVQNIWDKIKFDIKKFNKNNSKNLMFEVTLKLDGTSGTFYWNKGNFGVCSRNLELEEDENNTYWRISRKYNIKFLLRELGKNIALQGEIIGEGIQGNPEGIKGQEFYLFDIWDIDSQCYLDMSEKLILLKKISSMGFHIPYCPLIGILPLELFDGDIKKILKYADGNSLHADIREGIVFKSLVQDTRFKVVSNEYLLKDK